MIDISTAVRNLSVTRTSVPRDRDRVHMSLGQKTNWYASHPEGQTPFSESSIPNIEELGECVLSRKAVHLYVIGMLMAVISE